MFQNEAEPQRIVSLAPSNTEIVYALGLEDRLVGVTSYCDYPEAAKEKPILGGYTTVDIERVIEAQPDLILAAEHHEVQVIPRLEGLGLTVVGLNPRTLDEVMEAIILVGKCTGKEEEATQLVAEMQSRIKAVADRTANLTEDQRPRVFYATWHDPLMTWGGDSYANQMIVLAGGINIAQHLTGSPVIDLENVIFMNPQVIIADFGHGAGTLEFAQTEDRLKAVDARINNQVYGIDASLVRAGPRIVDGLELFAKMIHPEIFGPIE